MIVIVDYGMGNLGSIKNMLSKVGVESIITSEPELIDQAEKLIIPGVGAFHTGMRSLEELNLISVLQEKVINQKIPVLGICLGMQLLTNHSEEGDLQGLGWIDADTIKFKTTVNGKKYSIPHMGWEYVKSCKESKMMENMYDEPRFYFVHSYYVKCNNLDDVLLTANYGETFIAAFEKENITGVQFHPEKSHKFGIKIFENFTRKY